MARFTFQLFGIAVAPNLFRVEGAFDISTYSVSGKKIFFTLIAKKTVYLDAFDNLC